MPLMTVKPTSAGRRSAVRVVTPDLHKGAPYAPLVAASIEREKNIALLRSLSDTMLHGSLCALGGLTPYPVLSALDHFAEDFAPPAARAVD